MFNTPENRAVLRAELCGVLNELRADITAANFNFSEWFDREAGKVLGTFDFTFLTKPQQDDLVSQLTGNLRKVVKEAKTDGVDYVILGGTAEEIRLAVIDHLQKDYVLLGAPFGGQDLRIYQAMIKGIKPNGKS